VLPAPTNGILDTVPFHIRICGHIANVQAGRATTIIFYLGTSPTIANNIQVFSSSSHQLSTTNPSALLDVHLFVTGVGKQLYGYATGVEGNGTIATTLVSGATFIFDPNQDQNSQSSPSQGFTLGWNAATASTLETASIDVFELRI
jgi:hypothetical protein